MADFVWNPVLRAEVRHNVRKLQTSYARAAWNALHAAERTRLRFGRVNLLTLLDAADDLSAEKAKAIPGGTWDFFHVAAAPQARATCFATCDKLQADLAREIVRIGGSLRFLKHFKQ